MKNRFITIANTGRLMEIEDKDAINIFDYLFGAQRNDFFSNVAIKIKHLRAATLPPHINGKKGAKKIIKNAFTPNILYIFCEKVKK